MIHEWRLNGNGIGGQPTQCNQCNSKQYDNHTRTHVHVGFEMEPRRVFFFEIGGIETYVDSNGQS